MLVELGIVSIDAHRVLLPPVAGEILLDLGPFLDSVVELEYILVLAAVPRLLQRLWEREVGAVDAL